MNIFLIQDGAGLAHFKGENACADANGDFCARMAQLAAPPSMKNPPKRVWEIVILALTPFRD
ncbi:hypothetical protein ACEUBT_10315 [Aeromonas bivalvium]|uniref:hypothetical protein n=1 Tax=Aeromonas bivalvium TaxID=440079 RepID=UPI0038D15FE9